MSKYLIVIVNLKCDFYSNCLYTFWPRFWPRLFRFETVYNGLKWCFSYFLKNKNAQNTVFSGITNSGAEGNRTPVRTQIQCTSTVIVGVLTFPPESAHRQAHSFSSFMNFLLPQSFDNRVFRWLTPATFVADNEDRWATTRQLMLNYLQRLILNWTFYVVSSHEQLLHLQWARRNQYNPLL